MSKCLLTLMLVGMVALGGLGGLTPPAQGDDEPPVRLKKKKPRGDDKPMVEPDKPDEKRNDEKKDEKKEDKKTEPRESEPVTPQEEEKEVLQRVVENVHRVDERLAKSDLGEATQQTQRDILKDIESLIKRNENPPPSGGGGGQQDQNNGGGGGKSGGKKTSAGSKSRMQQQRGGGSKTGGEKRAGKDGKGGEQPGGRNGKNGNGGRGGDKDDHARKNADLDKHGVWGHLPQSLRAQMDAYSNPHPFMPKYDDLIKRYYRTISEQGRRKGE
jgi:hypothetical protein